MRLNLAPIWIALLLFASIFAHNPASALDEDVFDQYVASRFTFPSSPISPAWPTLPFDALQLAFGAEFNGNSVAFALSSADLFLWAGGRWVSLSALGASLPVAPGSAAARASFNGTDGVIVAVPNGIYFVVCDWSSAQPSKCSYDYIIALPFGGIRSVAAAGSTVLVAPLRGGLFALDIATNTCAPLRIGTPEPACNPYAGIVNGDYRGLTVYARTLCTAFAGSCLVPGSYTRNCSSFASQAVTEQLNVVAVHEDAQALLPHARKSSAAASSAFVVGGNETILFSSTQGLLWRKEYVGGVVDGTVMSMASSGKHLLIGAYEGLSMSNVTSIAALSSADSTQVFAGTASGVVVGPFLSSLPQAPVDHRYFNGPRWLASRTAEANENGVLQLASFTGQGWSRGIVGGAGGVWAMTPKGMSLIEAIPMTLSKKADYLQSIGDLRHDRLVGFSAGCNFKNWGDPSVCIDGDDDNDGLWTSVYTAGLAYKYAVTQNEEDRQRALHRFYAVAFLHNVTGIKGMVARSALKQSAPPPGRQDEKWYNSTTYPGYIWKGDTSSDEITGHMFVLPIVHDLVAKTVEEKAMARDLLCSNMDYIIDNGFTLVDADGTVTTWGHWEPTTVNMNYYDFDSRGLNSLQILSWLQSACRLCDASPNSNISWPDLRSNRLHLCMYVKALQYLVEEHQYDINILTAKIENPYDTNYSDDELMFLPYFTWALATGFKPENSYGGSHFHASIKRSYAFVAPDRSSLWCIMSFLAGGAPQDEFLNDCISYNLKRAPWELVSWPYKNSDRHDIWLKWTSDRFGRPDQAVKPISFDESEFLRWNSDPFDLDGGDGGSETDPGYFILPYWMARYYKLL